MMMRVLVCCCSLMSASVWAAEVELRQPRFRGQTTVTRAAEQPEAYRYLAFPSVVIRSPDEIWIAYKAGRRHAADAGAAIEVVSHRLSTGETTRVQRLAPPLPKLYQMGELARLADGTIGLFIDVHHVGWDNRHYRTGAEAYRWQEASGRFAGPTALEAVAGVVYGYPFDFLVEGRTTWQLSMTFGYLPGGRWGVDALRSEDGGRTWHLVRQLAPEFGGLRINESGFVRHGAGFLISTRGYDSHQRLHRTDAEFKLQRQVDLTETYPFINRIVGRPRLFIRDGWGYLIGRNYTQPAQAPAERGGTPNAMKLSLFRFDLETLAIRAHTVLDNTEETKVSDGYYAVPVFSEQAGRTILHVITYKGLHDQPPDILRLDYLWDEVK